MFTSLERSHLRPHLVDISSDRNVTARLYVVIRQRDASRSVRPKRCLAGAAKEAELSEVSLVQAPPEALRKSRNACGAGLVAVRIGRQVDEKIEIFDDIADRVRTAARHGAAGFLFTAGRTATDPFGPDPYVQSATFLAMAAALENQVPVRFLSEGLPARGFAPLFRRYRSLVAGQVRFVGPHGSGLAPLEPNAASVDARLRGLESLAEALDSSTALSARIDPVIPGISDDDGFLDPLVGLLANAGVRRVVAVPLRFNIAARERVRATLGPQAVERIARHYMPGRARRRVAPVPPGERLPLEREASLAWRLKMALEPHGVELVVCTCRDIRRGSCGLGVPPREDLKTDDQLALWAAG